MQTLNYLDYNFHSFLPPTQSAAGKLKPKSHAFFVLYLLSKEKKGATREKFPVHNILKALF